MKRVVIFVIVLGILGGIYKFSPNKVEFKQGETQVVEKKVEVDALDQAIKSKQDEKKNEIEAVAEKARQDAYTFEMKKVELEVVREFGKKVEDRVNTLETEVSL